MGFKQKFKHLAIIKSDLTVLKDLIEGRKNTIVTFRHVKVVEEMVSALEQNYKA